MKKAVAVITLCLLTSVVMAQTGRLALKGYDPVAYFTTTKAVRGSSSFKTSWMGMTWNFASKENLQKFVKNPQHYAPQYDGYCAYGVSKGKKAETDPEAWTIVNDKLYLNYSPDVKEEWLKDKANLIKVADKNWPELKDQK